MHIPVIDKHPIDTPATPEDWDTEVSITVEAPHSAGGWLGLVAIFVTVTAATFTGVMLAHWVLA